MEHGAADRAGPLLVSSIWIAAAVLARLIVQGVTVPSAPGIRHQAQGLDIDVLAAVVEIEEPTGPVLAS